MNRRITITTGASRKATVWQATTLMWSEFVDKLRIPQRSTETYEAYMRLSKEQKDELKDVGGYVGGSLNGARRKACNVTGRDLITLDLDNIPTGQTADILKRVHGLSCASAVYSTRKHSEYAPRLRVVIPTDRTMTPDEYEPVARKVAELIGIQYCDPTTFETSRLMYWPSCSSDGVYVCEAYDGNLCSADGVLGLYADWHDVSEWARVPGSEEALTRRNITKQEDPTTKNGIVGAFCRLYDIPAAMEKFLPGVYAETAIPDRYTYLNGSTTGGAVVYDDGKFLFSHHATDPCSGQLVNSFDMVRLHKYGDQDETAKEGTPTVRLPSYTAMLRLAGEDPAVSKKLAQERFEDAQEAYTGNQSDPAEVDIDWMQKLTVDGNGHYRKTINNVHVILRYDPQLKDRIVTDVFSNRGMLTCPVPWDASEERREWKDSDFSGIYEYIETFYGIASKQVVDHAIALIGEENRMNDVESYLRSLSWDGTKRVDTLLSDYLGADDNVYTRAVIRKSLVAAVARAIEGGVKYDTMPIFTGPQGIGKSTFLANLGREWFNDSLTTFEGKDAAEMINGTWINEVGELTAMSRQDMNSVKQFLSKREDRYRAAYGRKATTVPRRCVFFGTSNEAEFLRDQENRRFWPVDVGIHPAKKNVWEEMPGEVDQIWAEAFALWQLGETLTLTGEAADLALAAQRGHREVDSIEGTVLEYLGLMVPGNWDMLDLPQKKMVIAGSATLPEGGALHPIDKVCSVEFYELYMGNRRYMKNYDSKKINDVIRNAGGWQSAIIRFKEYGPQGGFRRV